MGLQAFLNIPSERTLSADLFAKNKAQRKREALNRVRPEHLALGVRKIDAMGPGTVFSKGAEMLMLAANNYLGLSGDPRLSHAATEAIQKWGNSTSGSRLLNGTNDQHIRLEQDLAAFKQVESVLLFQSGYRANLGVLNALLSKNDVVIVDKLVHASVIDGCTLAGATLRTFKHQDLESLVKVLESIDSGVNKLVVVDGIYSMDGNFAKLPGLIEVAHRYGARVMVDDAHSTGVAGPSGRGTADHFRIAEPDIVTGTLSKAFGCIGGFVGASKEVCEFITWNSRAFIYTTSLCPSVTSALIAAVDIVRNEPERRANLWNCTYYLLRHLKQMGFNTGTSETPIVPIILNDENIMFELVAALDRGGIFVSPVIYPACPKKEPRVRLSLSSDHKIADMDRVLYALNRHGRLLGVID